MLWTCIQEVRDLILGRDAGCPKTVLRADMPGWYLDQPQPLPCISFPIHPNIRRYVSSVRTDGVTK
jgi:hypothetical protein